jgi:hypothetical protein
MTINLDFILKVLGIVGLVLAIIWLIGAIW